MKKILLALCLVCAFAVSISAQNKIASHNGNAAPRFYTSLDDALTNAQQNDVIYLSGGTFSTTTAINTKIRLVGVGWHPSLDSTGATNRTVINSNLVLTSNADGSNFEGFEVVGECRFGQQNQSTFDPIDNVSIQKCFIQGAIQFYLPCNFISVSQSYFPSAISSYTPNSWDRGSLDNSSFLNNAIGTQIYFPRGQNNLFKNNIFFYQGTNAIGLINNSTFDDNIFNYTQSACNSCTFNRNLNVGTPSNSTVNENNVRPSISWTEILEDPGALTSGGALASFYATKNYHIKASFRSAYPNIANAGIYYGDLGWKTVPSTPWIYEKTIPTATDASGNLRVTIKVKAQSN